MYVMFLSDFSHISIAWAALRGASRLVKVGTFISAKLLVASEGGIGLEFLGGAGHHRNYSRLKEGGVLQAT